MSDRSNVVDAARGILAARRRRKRFLPAELLGEPAWDVLLDLLVSQSEEREVPLKDACIASGVPATTAMRCLEGLRSKGLVDHTPDPVDRRRKLLVLTPFGEECITKAVLECLPCTTEACAHGRPNAKAA